jgi:hypothetical protein
MTARSDRKDHVDPRHGDVTAATRWGTPEDMSETQPESAGRHAAPDDDPYADPPPVAGDGGDHRGDGPAEEGEEDDGEPVSGGARQPGADPEDEPEIERERKHRLDPEKRPDNVEVDNTQRDFDVEKGMFTDSQEYDETDEKFPPLGGQGA